MPSPSEQLFLPRSIPQGPCSCRCHFEDPHKVYRPHCTHLGANRYLRWCKQCHYTHHKLGEPFRKGRRISAVCPICRTLESHTEWAPLTVTCDTCGHCHKEKY